MDVTAHIDARCQNRANCTGPGCRVNTGKTERKRNHGAKASKED